MRKSLSVAICAAMLAFAGTSQASINPKPVSDALNAKFQQVSQLVGGSAPKTLKTDVAYKAGGDRSTSKAQDASDEDGNHAMLIAGLMIMGVIIKRRYNKGD